MQRAAAGFLATLPGRSHDRPAFPFQSDERENWNFVPIERKGLSLGDMDETQRRAAMALLSTGLSADGQHKFATIRALENVLREIEKGSGPKRDPDGYFFSVFGTPDAKTPWGWRVEGHHFSVNFTLKNGEISRRRRSSARTPPRSAPQDC